MRKKFVNVNKGWELNYWCERLGVKAEDLKDLVKRFGHDADVLYEKMKKGPRSDAR